jgi:hypothetical protein
MQDRWVAGKYRLGTLLGRGGMGVVYEATHGATGKRVAVKLIGGDNVQTLPDHVARFEREARAAGSVDTQHIVQVLDAGSDTEDGTPYIVMELLAGEDLLRTVQRLGPLPASVVVRVAAQALMGLTKAHDAGVIHRDIKSANLFLAARDDDELVVKLLDFGIAKILRSDLTATQNTSITRTGSMLGSPLYMSPEQARGAKDIDARTDLWSLGVVMYEALTGAAPHHDIETLGELILAICSEPSQPVQDAAPWVPPGVARVVHRALAIKPGDRFASAREMLDAVRALAAEGTRITSSELIALAPSERTRVAPRYVISAPGVELSESGAKARSLALDATVSDAPGAVATRGGPGRRRRGLIAVAFACLGAGALVVGGLSLRTPTRASSDAVTADPSAMDARSAPTATVTAEARVTRASAFHLRVSPPSARVEVDGVERPVADGSVTFTGTLGSIHAVRLWSGAREARASIAVTDSGLMPDAVALDERSASPTAGDKTRVAGRSTGKLATPAGAAAAPRVVSTAEGDGGLQMDTEFR